MFCKICGTQLSDDSRFCVVCGTKVEPIQTEATVAPAVPAKKKVKPIAIILPIIAVLLVAAIVLGVVFLGGKNSSDDKETDKENISSTAIADGTENTNTDVSQKPTDANYYLDKEIVYEYDENGEVYDTRTIVYYGKYRFPLEERIERNDYLSLQKFELDDDNKIIAVIATYKSEDEDENENLKIDIEYEEKDGKQVGIFSSNDSNVEIEIIYESDDEFTVAIKVDGELFKKWTCYINDDGYSVTEYYIGDFKLIYIYDGIKLIEQSEYIREGDSFELRDNKKNEYNNDGFLIETLSTNTVEIGKIIYERNENNVPIAKTAYHDGDTIYFTEIYEETDNKIVLREYDEYDEFHGSYEYGFDEGKLLYEKKYNEDGDLTSETTYNENGLVERKNSYSDGIIYEKTVYEYAMR